MYFILKVNNSLYSNIGKETDQGFLCMPPEEVLQLPYIKAIKVKEYLKDSFGKAALFLIPFKYEDVRDLNSTYRHALCTEAITEFYFDLATEYKLDKLNFMEVVLDAKHYGLVQALENLYKNTKLLFVISPTGTIELVG